MSDRPRPRILVVDDEEAILETMAFTFEDDYDVHTSSDARRALAILQEDGPFAVVLTDQRMPAMSGVEFLREVWKRHPKSVRMILTGFADMDAIIGAINDGHVYAYVTKPWEPDQLKQLMKQAVEHYELSVENERLMADLRQANVYLEAVMDELDTGALAVDAEGVVRAVNRPARDYLALRGDPRGRKLVEVLEEAGLAELGGTVYSLGQDDAASYEEVDVRSGERARRLRLAVHRLRDTAGADLGSVMLCREISHEPLERRFDDLLRRILASEGAVRAVLEKSCEELRALSGEAEGLAVGSRTLGQLSERLSRTVTAIENWLDVDDVLAREDYPDAQLLQDRMRVAVARWPLPDQLPERVSALARRLEEYYESGENPKQPVL